MKNIFYFLGLLAVLLMGSAHETWAQSSRIYNSPNSSYTASGPLNLKQILRGNQNAALGGRSQFYGGSNGRPFGLDNQNFSSGITAQDIQASRARRDAAAQRSERESLAALAQYDDDLAAFQRQQQQGNNSQGRVQSQRASGFTGGATGTGRRVYKQGERERFNKPRRVFNSLQ